MVPAGPDRVSPAIHLVRHGQSTWNVQRRVQGQRDDADLTDLGRRQMIRAAEELAGVPAVRLLTSDLRRARQSAEILGDALNLAPIATSLLREQSYGRLEGMDTDRAAVEWEKFAREVDDDGYPVPPVDVRPAGGESIRDVLARVGALLATPWVAEATGDVIVVSHGDAIRAMLSLLLRDDLDDLPWRPVGNGEVHSVYRTEAGEVRHTVTVDAAPAPLTPDESGS